jgi:hypothetical protein
MKNKLEVLGQEIKVTKQGCEDYLSLTEIYNGFGVTTGKSIETFIRSSENLEFLAEWELLHNPEFKSMQAHGIKEEAKERVNLMSVSKWVEQTNAIGIYSYKGRWGGTYAHSTIALKFCAYLSKPLEVRIYEEYLKYKREEYANQRTPERQEVADDYKVMTKAIQESISTKMLNKYETCIAYAQEADMLNVAVFGYTAKQFVETYPHLIKKGWNQRDYCSPAQLDCIHKLQNFNCEWITLGIDFETRKIYAKDRVQKVMPILEKSKGKLTNRPLSDLELLN